MIHGVGASRIGATIRMGDWIDCEQSMRDKIDNVMAKMRLSATDFEAKLALSFYKDHKLKDLALKLLKNVVCEV